MTCPGLASHTLAGFCALWLPSGTSSTEKLQKAAKPQPPQTTRPALPEYPVQAPPQLLHTGRTAFDLSVHRLMARARYPHTGRALCTLVDERCLHGCKTPAFSKTTAPHTTCSAWPQHPVQAPANPLCDAVATFDLAVAHGMPRAAHSHTCRALCAAVNKQRLHGCKTPVSANPQPP